VGDHGILFSHGPRLKLSWQVDCWIIMSGTTGPCGRPIAEGRDRPLRETDSGVWPLPVYLYDMPGFLDSSWFSFSVRMRCGPEVPEGVRDFGLARSV
jgi:hypothetical protein